MITSADQRLGSTSADEIKAHPFFAGVDWATIRNIESPFIPQLRCVSPSSFSSPPSLSLLAPKLTSRIAAQLPHRHVLLPHRGPQRRSGAAERVGSEQREQGLGLCAPFLLLYPLCYGADAMDECAVLGYTFRRYEGTPNHTAW